MFRSCLSLFHEPFWILSELYLRKCKWSGVEMIYFSNSFSPFVNIAQFFGKRIVGMKREKVMKQKERYKFVRFWNIVLITQRKMDWNNLFHFLVILLQKYTNPSLCFLWCEKKENKVYLLRDNKLLILSSSTPCEIYFNAIKESL